jgi:predicted TIM-barrel fold metal-dependent hydrolase
MSKSPSRNGGKRAPQVTELPKITVHSDTRDILAHARRETETDDYFIVDVDAHVMETAFWSELTDRIDNDVYRQMAKSFRDRGGSPPGLLNATPGMLYQDVFGRIPHQQRLAEAVPAGRTHPQVTLVQRAMDSMGIDYMVVFPTPMLVLGMHPQAEVEVALGNAFNRWLVEEILPQEPRVKAMLYLPFNHPEACLDVVERYGDAPGVIGFTVTSTRFRPVHHDAYMPLYAAMEASGKPFGFHSGFHWGDQSMQQCNRFLSMHAISFVHFNLVHLTNWVINGLPERFPRLKVIWIESGLAWLPFIMQRLDSEYMMRSSEAPLLRRRPREYIRDMYFTSQPLERSNMKLTEATFAAINADTQLLFASDWPPGISTCRARSPACRSSTRRPSATSSASTRRGSST